MRGWGTVARECSPDRLSTSFSPQVYLASIMVTLAMGAQLAVQPFANPMMNRLETLGLVATFMTQARDHCVGCALL